ncbi:porin family protein [Xanthomarina gelatinilytica]|uniref:porin family protein n=1 Tax=Xanthomarina gelatinilytica TaxID=1137281 RepID=UPI003AA818C5
MQKYLLCLFLVFVSHTTSSQVLLTLLFGEKLNSPNIEFGLEGGYNWSDISGLESSNRLGTFNLGFYFDFKLKNQLYLYTGVLVKSNLGIDDLSLSDVEASGIDYIDDQGSYSQRINYFLVPAFAKYVFDNKIYVEAGPQFGLRYKAFVEYYYENDDVEITIRQENKNNINPIEAGAGLGVGYKFSKTGGLSVGVKYFQGFVNVYKGNSNTKNNSLFLKMNLPIGAKKSANKHNEIEPNNN